MEVIDYVIFFAYLVSLVGVGLYHYAKTKNLDDYYLGSKKIGAWHIGMSVVATDVGGGFSIGLGGLGFTIGLSGSWMLFTGLIGAWMSAVWLIPKVFRITAIKSLYTMPQFIQHFYGRRAAFLAAIISFVGYLGFTASQLLAGAKLATATFDGLGLSLHDFLFWMGLFTVVYTALGGIKAVIYTDTIQWLVLISGLVLLGIPFAYYRVGGWHAIQNSLPETMLRFDQVSPVTLINWSLTIIPIWFIGMTLYQRIYASRDETQAKRAWFLAGLLEWPIMAFMGVILGMLARVAFESDMFTVSGEMDPELGLPMLIRTVLPVGVTGVLLASYFSAVMSTADSCLMAASGNFVTDIIGKIIRLEPRQQLKLSQWSTLFLGMISVWISMRMQSVLELMLLSYAFMVSGLLVPILMAISGKTNSSLAATLSMLLGGTCAAIGTYLEIPIVFGLNPIALGLAVSLFTFLFIHFISKPNHSSL